MCSAHVSSEAAIDTTSCVLQVKAAKVLCVGAGGIGCELLKTLVLTGFQHIQVVRHGHNSAQSSLGCSKGNRHAAQEPGRPANSRRFLQMTASLHAIEACNLKLPLFHHPSAITQCPVLAVC